MRRASAAVALFGLFVGASVSAQQVDDVLDVELEAKEASVASQRRVESLSQETDDLAAEYRAVLDQIESLDIYNAQLDSLLQAQDEELASLQQQIDNVTTVGRGMTPLMLRLLATLDEFVELDVPFLPNERRKRLEELHAMMERADVTDAEKFRRILEAYQVENEYGRTIDAYSSEIEIAGAVRSVDFLRIGRVSLVYMTPDESIVGAWDARRGEWAQLDPAEYRRSIRQGLRMARKQTAPDLIPVPVPSPKES